MMITCKLQSQCNQTRRALQIVDKVIVSLYYLVCLILLFQVQHHIKVTDKCDSATHSHTIYVCWFAYLIYPDPC